MVGHTIIQRGFIIINLNLISEHCFKQFLNRHIQSALGKGFDDTLGRHVNTAHFEVHKI